MPDPDPMDDPYNYDVDPGAGYPPQEVPCHFTPYSQTFLFHTAPE